MAWETVNKLQNTHSANLSTREKKSEKKKTLSSKKLKGTQKTIDINWIGSCRQLMCAGAPSNTR